MYGRLSGISRNTAGHARRRYIEALLVNPEAADEVWALRDKGEITTYAAAWAWWVTASHAKAASGVVES